MQKIRFFILALTAFTVLAFAASSAQAGATQAGPTCSANKPICTASFQPEPVLMSTWIFEGCWSYYLTSPCRDIFRDSSGAYWICANCGQTKNPGPGTCGQIGIQALDRGYWCS
jgi:hypothetical protein